MTARRNRSKPTRSSPVLSDAAQRLFALARPIEGTLAESYLRARGISTLEGTGSLRFHPRCYYRSHETEPIEYWPALIAAVTDLSGALTGAHRTWLDPEGFGETTLGKAPIETPRRSIGVLSGSGVHFGVSGEVLIAGEGIETVLSLRAAIPSMPAIAALSAANLSALMFPVALRRLYIARDDDPAGDRASKMLSERAEAAGIEVYVLSPRLKDFNEDLRAFGVDALRATLHEGLSTRDLARFME